jgi:hypothetical protein
MIVIDKKTPGYISTKHIKTIRTFSSSELSTPGYGGEIECNADSADVNLVISNSNFRCTESFFGWRL